MDTSQHDPVEATGELPVGVMQKCHNIPKQSEDPACLFTLKGEPPNKRASYPLDDVEYRLLSFCLAATPKGGVQFGAKLVLFLPSNSQEKAPIGPSAL